MNSRRVAYLHPEAAVRERATARLTEAGFRSTPAPAPPVPAADDGDLFDAVDAVVVTGAVPDPVEACRRLHERPSDLAVVLLAPRDGPVAAALRAGVDDYVPRDGDDGTADWDLLAARLDRLLGTGDAGESRSTAEEDGDAAGTGDSRVRGLHAATRDLVSAESPEEIATTTVAAARDVLGLPISGVRLLDDGGERLVPAAMSTDTRATLGDRPDYRVDGPTPAARAFREDEAQVVVDPEAIPDDRDRSSLVGAMYLPLGGHGTLSVATTEAARFDDDDRRLAGILAANAGVALANAERQAALTAERDRLETFASVLSHDLRNPLNVASGHVELAVEHGDTADLDAAADALERIRRRIDSLLALAREGDAVDDPVAVSLAAAARRAWETTETAGAALDVRTDRFVVADRERLERLLENLFRNAVEHGGAPRATDDVATGGPQTDTAAAGRTECDGGPRAPELTVAVVDTGDGFAVVDDGVGFSAPPGQLFDSGFSTERDGTGLGLAIVQRIADAHGWSVTASERDGGGARFDVADVEFGGSGGGWLAD